MKDTTSAWLVFWLVAIAIFLGSEIHKLRLEMKKMSQAQCNALTELAKDVSANTKAIEAVAGRLKGQL